METITYIFTGFAIIANIILLILAIQMIGARQLTKHDLI